MNLIEKPVVIEHFFGVYLLYCLNPNPRYNGRVYIGYTCDPSKRILQHNSGIRAGGARRTHSKGPWKMVLVVHGFHNAVSALRFEWAWQNPRPSLQGQARKSSKETKFDHAVRVLCLLLRSPPWHKLPLTIRWISEKYMREFDPSLSPPTHMPIVFGPVIGKKLAKKIQQNDHEDSDPVKCFLCHCEAEEKYKIKCINPRCSCDFHLVCLARHFIGNDDSFIPVEGKCPSCDSQVLWGDLIRKKLGCTIDFKVLEVPSLEDDQLSEKSDNISVVSQ